jgi:hypothetical protein
LLQPGMIKMANNREKMAKIDEKEAFFGVFE